MYGIGAKMVLKMGYQPGKGLGKNLQGIPAPIQVVECKGRRGLGIHPNGNGPGPDGQACKMTKGAKVTVPTPHSQKNRLSQNTNGGIGLGSSSTFSNKLTTAKSKMQILKDERKLKKKAKWQTNSPYVTSFKELKQKQNSVVEYVVQKKVIEMVDLTKSESVTRNLDSLGIHHVPKKKSLRTIVTPENNYEDYSDSENVEILSVSDTDSESILLQTRTFEIPELIHNLNLIIDDCEEDIAKYDRKLKRVKHKESKIERKLTKLKTKIEDESNKIDSTKKLTELVKRLMSSSIKNETEAKLILGEILEEYPAEWRLYRLHKVASSIAERILLSKLETWNPLEMLTEPFQLLTDWKNLFITNDSSFYDILLRIWMPAIRRNLKNWDIKDVDPMLCILDHWKSVLPDWVFDYILDQLILPKIIAEINKSEWSLASDHTQIYTWIHPWLPVTRTNLERVFVIIEGKLADAVAADRLWQPNQVDSVKRILSLWATVFDKVLMDAFVVKNIAPKLKILVEELAIVSNPEDDMQSWNCILELCNQFPAESFVTVFNTTFFPKWLQFLATWLNQKPTLREIQSWYSFWRSSFPEMLIQDHKIINNLRKALEMIDEFVQKSNPEIVFNDILHRQPLASNSGTIPMPPLPVSVSDEVKIQKPEFELMANAIKLTAQVPNVFRDLVQLKCEQLGVLFIPIPNRYFDGKQVYRCGEGDVASTIYICDNVIFTLRDGAWIPSSLQQILQIVNK